MRIKCKCGAVLKVPESAVGKRIRCPKCKAALDVPGEGVLTEESKVRDGGKRAEQTAKVPPPPPPLRQTSPEPSATPDPARITGAGAAPAADDLPGEQEPSAPPEHTPVVARPPETTSAQGPLRSALKASLAYPGWVVVSAFAFVSFAVGFGGGLLVGGHKVPEVECPTCPTADGHHNQDVRAPGGKVGASEPGGIREAEQRGAKTGGQTRNEESPPGPQVSEKGEREKQAPKELPLELEKKAEPAKAEAEVVPEPDRPEYMPCRIEEYWSRGDLKNWWTLRYEAGRLVAARDEQLGYRKASVKISTVEKVDAEMNQRPYQLGYEYDDSGRLVRFIEKGTDSEPGKNVRFTYGDDGKLVRYSDEDGEHNLSSSADDSGTLLVATDKYSMAGMRVSVRYEYPSKEHPLLGRPMVWGRELLFGEEAAYIKFPNRPEALVRRVRHVGPGGGISEMRGFGLGGYPGDRYEFVYDCSEPVRWHK